MTARVLLVDDDAATLQALTAVLETRLEQVAIDTCESAVAALDNITKVDYDAIVSDIKMPVMDGLQLMERVLTIRPTTPTLLVTGHGDRDLAARALNSGAYAFIQKPIDRDYFVAWLRRAIQLRQLSRKVEDQNRMLEETVQARMAELTESNAALAEAGRRMTTILESISDGFFAMDADWRFTYVNDAAEHLCRMSRNDMLGRRWHDVFPGAVGTLLEAEYRRAAAERTTVESENYYEPLQRWFSAKIYPTDTGGFSVYFQDITERKRTDEQVRMHRHMIETVLNCLPIGVALARGRDLIFELTNPAYQAIAPGKEMIGQTIQDVWPETQPLFTERCLKVLETGLPYQAEDEPFSVSRSCSGPLESSYFSWSMHRINVPGEGTAFSSPSGRPLSAN